jgi:hypothetical protein
MTKFYSNPLFGFYNFSLSADYVSNGNLFIRSGLNTFFNLDSNYNFVSYKYGYKYYSFNGSTTKALNIKEDSVFFYYSGYQPNGPLTPYSPKILKVNESGDTIGSIHVPNDTLAGGRIIKKTNSFFLNIGYKVIPPMQSIFHVSKIDTSGAKIWSKRLLSPFGNGQNALFSAFTTLKNNTNVVSFIPSSNNNKRGVIYCFNDNGDSLWTQYFKNDVNYKTSLLDIIATSDSGLLACGQIEEPNGTLKNYIVKTNSSGLILDAKTELLEKKKSYFHLYPNPANYYSTIHYIGEANATLRISNSQGTLLYSKNFANKDETFRLDVSQFNSGFYFCSIAFNGKIITTKKLIVIR